jgi:hypothetical protein
MKKHLPLIVGIALPIIFIIIISIVLFVPSLYVKPQHNFIYTTLPDYYSYNQGYQETYKVRDSHIVTERVVPREKETQLSGAPTLYVYDVHADTSHQVTFDEVKGLAVDPGPSSPDGYTVAYEYNNDGIFELFGSNNENNRFFISKGNGKKKLNGLIGDRYWYQGNFRLIGWVK